MGVFDVLPQVLWTKKFLEDQGVEVKETILYQDNMSSMLLERNGRQSSTKRTKNMDIRYFYVSEHIQNKTLSLKHCPTEEMLADYFTKPLQGSLFVHLRNHIMGAEFDDGDHQTQRSVLEHYDDHLTTKASEQDEAVSDITTTASGREQVASNHSQDGNISSPAAWDQNHENVCVVGTTKNQNKEEARDGSQDQDQNYEKNYGKKGHSKRTNEKQGKEIKRMNEKQMTYREALLGLDNSEPSSDF